MENKKKKLLLDNKYLDWLAGLTDGDGCFTITKKGYVTFELTIDTRDINCLYQIKKVFGGSIKPGKGKFNRYRLHDKTGITAIVNGLNGRIRNPTRLLQLNRVCELYNIHFKETSILTYDNGWLSGFIDADGSVYMNKTSVQVIISASQKNKYLLDLIAEIYGGKVYTHGKFQAFKWTLYKKKDILDILEYFKEYPLKSKKMIRINLIKAVYTGFEKGAHRISDLDKLNNIDYKRWLWLMEKWDNYSTTP